MSVQIAMWQTVFRTRLSILQASLDRLLMAAQGAPKKVPAEEGKKEMPPAGGGVKGRPAADEGKKEMPPAGGGMKERPAADEGKKGMPPADGGVKKMPGADGGMKEMPKGTPDEGGKKGFPTWAIILIVVVLLCCLLPICIFVILQFLGMQITDVFGQITNQLQP